MPRGIDWLKAVFFKSENILSTPVPEAIPEYIPSAPALMNTPVSSVRVGGTSYSLSGPTKLIAQAYRLNRTVSYLSIQRTLGEISLNISRNPSMIATSTEKALLLGDQLYSLQRGFYTLYSRSELGCLPPLLEGEIDNLLHFERKANYLNCRLQKVEAWERFILPRDPRSPNLVRRNLLNNLLIHGEKTLLDMGIKRRRLPLTPLPIRIPIPKRELFFPFRTAMGQLGSFFRNAGEAIKDEFSLGWKDIRANPITIGLAIITTVAIVGAVTYWASERETVKSFYDN